jgi:GT2 family glycosyltransferase
MDNEVMDLYKKDFVTIIIPCRNEVKHIKQAVESALGTDYPAHLLEVFIVDGMSDDGTRELLANFNYPNVKVIDNKNKTAPYAFNVGIQASRGEFVMTHSARVIMSKNYLSECVRIFNNKSDVVYVGNSNCNNIYDNEEGRIIALATDSKMAIGFSNPRISKEGYANSADSPLYRRSLFDKIGFFDETLTRNQDDEFNYRLLKAGFKIYATDKISIKYFVRSSFKKLFNQNQQYGYWKVFVNKKHQTITTSRQLVPALFVLFLFLGLPFFALIGYPLIYFLILLFYLTITFFEALRLSKNQLLDAFMIQYAFFNYHIGYGSGYIKGIIDFFILRKRPSEKHQQLTR